MANEPQIKEDSMYQLLRDGDIEQFNARRAAGDEPDLCGCDLRGVDLQGLQTEGLDFHDCYFRKADLRGLDLSGCNLEGASINGAKISGTYFPAQLTAEEINLSQVHGTRMRYRS